MFGIPIEQFVPVASFLGMALLGALAAFGMKWGQRTPTPAEKTIEVAGALVDNSAVRELAAALVAHTAMLAAQRVDYEKERQAQYRMAETATLFMKTVESLTDEIAELRRSVGDVSNQIARMK